MLHVAIILNLPNKRAAFMSENFFFIAIELSTHETVYLVLYSLHHHLPSATSTSVSVHIHVILIINRKSSTVLSVRLYVCKQLKAPLIAR